MKIRILDRILVAIAGLLALAGCAAIAAQLFFQKDVIGKVSTLLEDENCRIWIIAVMAALALLGCYCLLMLFRHRGHNDKFVMQKTENGELSISLKAMETMVQKCLDPHKELSVQSIRLENQRGGLVILIRGTVAGGVSIPLTVDALQQQIRQYVTACSGVEVKDIRVRIESSGPDAKEALFAIDPPAARALPGKVAEKAPEAGTAEPEEMSQKEIEQVTAVMPAPNPSDAEDTEAPVTVSAAAAAAAEMLKNEAPVEEDDRPIHQRLFSNQEEPCVMPMPPEPAPAEPTEAPAEEETPAEPAEKAEEEMPAEAADEGQPAENAEEENKTDLPEEEKTGEEIKEKRSDE